MNALIATAVTVRVGIWGRALRAFAGICLSPSVLLGASTAAAQGLFPQWGASGVPVRSSPAAAISALPIPDGHGGTFVVWRDHESTDVRDNVRVQHLRPDGSADVRWPAGGLRIGEHDGVTLSPPVPDGAGGIYVEALRGDAYRLLRLEEDATIAPGWAADGGVPVGYDQLLATDRSGAVWLVRLNPVTHCPPGDHCSYWVDFYVVRIDRDGKYATGWEPPGRLTLTTIRASYAWFLGWRPTRDGVVCGVAETRCCEVGSFVEVCSLTTSSGVASSRVAFGDRHVSYFYDGDPSGNDFVGSGEFFRSHLQRAVGGVTWPERWGFPAGVAPAWSPEGVVADLSGGAFVRTVFHAGFLSFAATGRRLNHVLDTGASDPLWPADGLSIDGAGVQFQSAVKSTQDGRGGCMIVWQDMRSGTDSDIYALRFGQDGSRPPGWPTSGYPLAHVPGSEQTSAEVASDSLGNVFVTWIDTRQGAANVFAQKLSTDFVVATEVQRASARFVDDGAVELTWQFARGPERELTVQRDVDAQGWSALGAALRSGARDELMFIDRTPTLAGERTYRLLDRTTGWTGGEVSIASPGEAFVIAGVLPNPMSAASRIAIRSPSMAAIELAVTDPLGRTVARRTLAGFQAGAQSVHWAALTRLPAGLYWLRARQSGVERSVRFVVTR